MSPCRHQCSYTEVQGPRTRWVLTSKNISTMSIKHLAGSTLASESFIKLASPLPTPAKAWDCPPCALTSTRPELLSSFGSSSKDIQGPRTWHQGPSAGTAGTRWHLQVASRYSCQSPSPNHWPTMSQLRDIHSRRNSWHGPRDRVPESANSVDMCGQLLGSPWSCILLICFS